MDTEFSFGSAKMQAFVEAYLELWNATEAAKRAQYKCPAEMGSRLLKRVDVQTAIKARLDELSMPANEVLARITQQAKVSIALFLKQVDYTDPKTGLPATRIELNWENVQNYGYLIKSLSWSKNGDPIVTLVDSQRALELLGKHHGLFVDRTDITSGGAPIQIQRVEVVLPPEDGDGNT